MKKALIALAFGTFGLGIAEYVMMGILPFIAGDFRVSIPQAGHLISAYALGVCIGAPIVAVFARKWPLKRILYLLVFVMIAASLAMSLCTRFEWMLVLRFLAGLPHGAYFGVSSIVADRLSKEGSSSFAVAIMCSGMTVANLVGIPLGTFLTEAFSWRIVFGFSGVWDIVTLVVIARWIPEMDALPDCGLKREFRFLKTLAPWLLISATVLGNAGVFCFYSYVSPTLTQLAGIPVSWLSFMMVLSGAGMVIGNLFGGKLADRFGKGRTCRGIEMAICVFLLLIFLSAHWAWCLLPLMFLVCGGLFAMSSPQQLLLLRFSEGGELMGGAMVQLAFNLGNAIGAWLGGLPIVESSPVTYHYPSAIGAVLAALGVVCYAVFCKKYESSRENSPVR